MRVTLRNWIYIRDAVYALFYIKNQSDDDPALRGRCQDMIDILFEKFPGVMPVPSRLLTKQNSDVVDQIARVMKR